MADTADPARLDHEATSSAAASPSAAGANQGERPHRPLPRPRLVAAMATMTVFAAGLVAADWSPSRYGLIPAGRGRARITRIGEPMLPARDSVYDTFGPIAVLACIATAGVVSAVIDGTAAASATGRRRDG
ncbi:MAG: hypothetical protein QOE61_1113 [Micromonosporaceae bacterium]|nr:hypothetical protein [Micromonosporaceae bacterium]